MQAVDLLLHADDVLFDVVDVLVFFALLVLQIALLLQPLDPTRGRVAAILQRAASE